MTPMYLNSLLGLLTSAEGYNAINQPDGYPWYEDQPQLRDNHAAPGSSASIGYPGQQIQFPSQEKLFPYSPLNAPWSPEDGPAPWSPEEGRLRAPQGGRPAGGLQGGRPKGWRQLNDQEVEPDVYSSASQNEVYVPNFQQLARMNHEQTSGYSKKSKALAGNNWKYMRFSRSHA